LREALKAAAGGVEELALLRRLRGAVDAARMVASGQGPTDAEEAEHQQAVEEFLGRVREEAAAGVRDQYERKLKARLEEFAHATTAARNGQPVPPEWLWVKSYLDGTVPPRLKTAHWYATLDAADSRAVPTAPQAPPEEDWQEGRI
jgi:hypothetical protein